MIGLLFRIVYIFDEIVSSVNVYGNLLSSYLLIN